MLSRLKLFLGLSTALLMLTLIAPVTYAGVSWTGVDPVFTVNGHGFNVWIEWPSEYTCSIDGPIQVDVAAPRDATVVFISESSDDLGCGVVTQTSTEIDPKGGHKVHVGARVASGSAFPVNVKVSLNGELVRTYSGESNNRVSGRPAPLP